MTTFLRKAALAATLGLALQGAMAQSEATALSALSTLPIASVVGTSDASAVSVAIPLVLAVGGSVLLVRSVEASARGMVVVLERVSDGARASVELVGKAAGGASVAVGQSVTIIAFGAGVLLSVAGQAIAFLPNEIGRRLMHSEKLTP